MSAVRIDDTGATSNIDRALGAMVNGLAVKPHPWVALAATLASQRIRQGSTCVELDALSGTSAQAEAFGVESWPAPAPWREVLEASGVASDGTSPAPLVLTPDGRLYLYRYWLAERSVAHHIALRTSGTPAIGVPEGLVTWIDRLFPNRPGETDWQRVAAVTALLGSLAVVVGGPGTGKTSTVVRILALLALSNELSGTPKPSVALLAPTGKAAQRLAESIQRAKSGLALPTAVLDSIPEAASTLHRALYGGRRFDALGRYERPDPLLADVVVIDEASMADLAMLGALFDAVAPSGRIIVLGDDQQLASVEAGSVLGDLTAPCRGRGYGRKRVELLERLGCGTVSVEGRANAGGANGLRDQVVELKTSHRFDAQSGIGALVRALRHGRPEEVVRLLDGGGYSDIDWIEPALEGGFDARFERAVLEGYAPFLAATTPTTALEALGRFRVLAAHRRGQYGVETLGARVERAIATQGAKASGGNSFRRPIIVTENSYRLDLFNGDIGVIWRDGAGVARTHFVTGAGLERVLSVPRLPAHETAYVMSVHKSQGSEFDEVLCMLPGEASPLLTRELLYTAVSRARRRVILFASRASVMMAVERTVKRASGLGRLVWGLGEDAEG